MATTDDPKLAAALADLARQFGAPAVRAAITPPGEERDQLIAPPSQGYFTGEDNLRISSFNSLTNVVLTVSGRFFDLATRQIVPFKREHTPNTDRSLKQTYENFGAGFLLNAMVRATTAAPLVGHTYVLLEIVRGRSTSGELVGVLGADYCTARQGIAWPGSPVRSSIDGGGVVRVITGSDPAAGANLSETVPTGARWQPLYLTVTLVTSGVAANRRPILFFDDGATAYARSPQAGVTAATTTVNYVWVSGLPHVTNLTANAQVAGMPEQAALLAGHRITTQTDALDAGDNFGAPVYVVREFLEAA